MSLLFSCGGKYISLLLHTVFTPQSKEGPDTIIEPLNPKEREEQKKAMQKQLDLVNEALKSAKLMRLTSQIKHMEAEIRRLENNQKLIELGYVPLTEEGKVEKISLTFYNKPIPPDVLVKLHDLGETFKEFEIWLVGNETLMVGRWGESKALVAKW
jgi:aryl carrier-like protein